MAEDTGAIWKQKYYDTLEEYEAKERQWSEIEDLMRRAISRLTLAADGLDSTLDRQLKELRDGIRDRADNKLLKRRIEAMSQTLAGLDRERQTPESGPTAVSILEELLEKLPLPKGTGRSVKALKKDLTRAKADTPTGPLIKGFADLFGQSLELVQGDSPAPKSASGDTASPGKEGGLFSRLLGKPDNGPGTAKADPLEAARALLSSLCQEAEQLAATGDSLRTVCGKVEGSRTEAELQKLGCALLEQLATPATASAPANEESGPAPEEHAATDTDRDISIQEVLLQLLETLQLPAEFSARRELIQGTLEAPEPPARWNPVLEDIAGLVSDMRARVQREKKELEEFLKQVTERLQEVDQHLQGESDARAVSLRNTRDLDEAVKEQVKGLQSSVEEAGDVDQLKGAVQTHLNSILNHMEQHRKSEEEQHTEAEEKVASLQQRLQDMEREADQLRERVQEERAHALTDALTGIPNRMAFDERIEQEVARWKRFNTPLALLVWDIDRFKHVNDTYGHKAGDKVLKTVATRLNEQIRETDFLARFGGEEFALIMTGTDLPVMQEVADKLRASVAECGFHFRDTSVQVTISCGMSLFQEGETVEQVFERADAALYQAKEAGRNRCVVG